MPDGSAVRFAGMFREFGPVGLPVEQQSIFDSVSDEALPDAAEVVGYLRAGHVLIDMMDVSADPFEPSRQVMNGSSIRTDGDWLWREDLAYYVRRHRVQVPEDLLTLIRKRRYLVPPRDGALLRECALVAEDLMF